ncbi:hypothetical protein LTR78_000051 [Recurvomyces mirabilis]|uniref:Ca3427-like PBP 2 domain-containing protein n=1 Tax=Recurvomyces mirabilis TaxID=574656 RepID=A0AAE0WXV1_9PEZI|nr:hypothetical protein LTR78_000051 [Recurvomyces mirabilis]KAK5161707.1 hypothetical protein LTS14_000052 [Recurvomyces mirabilis]
MSHQQNKLRIGYIPEHFSTPLHFAQKHCNLNADLIAEPLGTGALTARLKAPSSDPKAFDVAIGLTEGFVADLGRSRAGGKEAGFGLVGTYVQSPLCWAISTGAERDDIKTVEDLRGKRVGVSRIGSGSYVMSYVLADSHGWLEQGKEEPFGIEVIGDFAALRNSVRKDEGAKETDFFMWEHFTTKHYWDNGELKRIGEIYTPWPSWMIAARDPLDPRLGQMFEAIDKGVQYYKTHKEEAVEYISTAMHYSKTDAEAWMETVRFAEEGVRGVKVGVMGDTVKVLKKAGVLDEKAGDGGDGMVAIVRGP